MLPRRNAWLFFVLIAAGCASQPVRTPTPARDLNNQDLVATPKPEDEHYYIMIFGAETRPRLPRRTHTWATMIKTLEPPGCPPQVTEVLTISWLPAELDIHPFRFWVEKGANLDLDATLAEVLRHGEHVSVWGPYETWHGLYHRFALQKSFLDAGLIGYQCIDGMGEAARTGQGCNCFHSISDMDPQFDRRQYPLISYGDAASKNIVRQLFGRPILIHAHQTHDWLIPALCLNRYPIDQRRYHGQAVEFTPTALLEQIASGSKPRRRLLP